MEVSYVCGAGCDGVRPAGADVRRSRSGRLSAASPLARMRGRGLQEGRQVRSMDISVHRPRGHSSTACGSTYETSTNRLTVSSLQARPVRVARRGGGRATTDGDWWRFRASAVQAVAACDLRAHGTPALRHLPEGLEWQNRALFHSLARNAPRRAKEAAGQKPVRFQRFPSGCQPTNENYTPKPFFGPKFWKSGRFCQE